MSRILHADRGYPNEFDYIVDLQADLLPDNYMASYQRHLALRKAVSALESEAEAQFTSRLTKGLTIKYWRIFEEKEALDLRNKDGLYLPAWFVLKSQGLTCVRLVLDLSGSLNSALLKAPNMEEKILSVLRRIQGMPVL